MKRPLIIALTTLSLIACDKDEAKADAKPEAAAEKPAVEAPADEKPAEEAPADEKPEEAAKPAAEAPALPDGDADARADFLAMCGVVGELLGDGPDEAWFGGQLDKLELKSEFGKSYRDYLKANTADALYNKAGSAGFLATATAAKVDAKDTASADCAITVEVMQGFEE